MCNQRDRLIGYVYSEGDASELREVQLHLDTCAECRAEVAGLRAVREDLLAWNVPEQESVWRPFVPAPASATPWWQQVPSWAMAAAAGVMFVCGAAGGTVAHAFLSEPEPTIARQPETAVVPVNAGAVGQAGQNDAGLRAFESRLVQIQQQVGALDARVQRGSLQSRPVAAGVDGVDHDALIAELVDLREQLQQQLGVMASMYANFDQQVVKKYDFRNGAIENRLKNLEAFAQLQVQGQGR